MDLIRIGIISDTHGYLDPMLFEYFNECDEIWHAGDIGDAGMIESLQSFRKFRGVYGNVDGPDIRILLPGELRFTCGDVDVYLIHIAGYPGHYDRLVREQLSINPPQLLVAGHSHILKVMYDKKFDLLYVNPGAAGKTGPHLVRTAVRFTVSSRQIHDLEVIELGNK